MAFQQLNVSYDEWTSIYTAKSFNVYYIESDYFYVPFMVDVVHRVTLVTELIRRPEYVTNVSAFETNFLHIAYDTSVDPSLSFTVTTVTNMTHLVVSSTTGMTAGDTIVQGLNSTTITTVTDGTHLVVGDSTGWVVVGATLVDTVDEGIAIELE